MEIGGLQELFVSKHPQRRREPSHPVQRRAANLEFAGGQGTVFAALSGVQQIASHRLLSCFENQSAQERE
jgi:hypothetical protein